MRIPTRSRMFEHNKVGMQEQSICVSKRSDGADSSERCDCVVIASSTWTANSNSGIEGIIDY